MLEDLPKKMNLKLIEPLKEFFKDEVRVLGNSLGLVKEISFRHPFPGPGLGIRIPVGNITVEKIKILQEADYIYINELNKNNLYNKDLASLCCTPSSENSWSYGGFKNIRIYLFITSSNI